MRIGADRVCGLAVLLLGAMAAKGQAASAAVGEARVGYSRGMLVVEADGVSLNGILRKVARLTGMRMQGEMEDERVYGTYGPASAKRVLEKLLDGTGSNVMFVETRAGAPVDLILTARAGVASPPRPGGEGGELGRGSLQPETREMEVAPGAEAGRGGGVVGGGAGNGAGGAGMVAYPLSPNGVKTPVQIAAELRELGQER